MQKYKTRRISLGKKSYEAIIADTSTKRAIGLMFREHLPAGQCMLFTFSGEGSHAIWMRNMRFPIDAVWLDRNNTVIDVKQDLKPCTSIFNCPQYEPRTRAYYLIEVNAGDCRKAGIKPGTRAKL
jgi:uncharacterized membrane protein (UPF0127 family)